MNKRNDDPNKLPVHYFAFRDLVRSKLLKQSVIEVFYVQEQKQYLSYKPDKDEYEIRNYYPDVSYAEDWHSNPKVQRHQVNHKVLFRLASKKIIGIFGTRTYMSGRYKQEKYSTDNNVGLDILFKSEQQIQPTTQPMNVSDTVMWRSKLQQKITQAEVYWLDQIDEKGNQSGYPWALKLTFANQEFVWIALIEEGVSEGVDVYGQEFMTLYFSEKVQEELEDGILADIATHIDVICISLFNES